MQPRRACHSTLPWLIFVSLDARRARLVGYSGLFGVGGMPSVIADGKKIVGAWSWTYIEGRGRMVFTTDHKVKAGFPPEEDKGRPLRDEDFTYLQSGTWRLEGDILVTEMDNSPYITWYAQTFKDEPEEICGASTLFLRKRYNGKKLLRSMTKRCFLTVVRG